MIHADTEGLLDRCHCGAVAGFETDSPAPFRMVQVRARCTECQEQTNWFMSADSAMIEWNMKQREAKRSNK
jgi:hypothetical protein